MATNNLGAELQQLSHLLEALIIKEPDFDKAKKIRDEQEKVLSLIRHLVSANVNAATKEYEKACGDLEKANAKVLEALADLKKVAQTIDAVAQAVELAGQLAAAAA
jgi:hypothetical protein